MGWPHPPGPSAPPSGLAGKMTSRGMSSCVSSNSRRFAVPHNITATRNPSSQALGHTGSTRRTVSQEEQLLRDPSLWYMRPAFWNSVAAPWDLPLQRTILIEMVMMEFLLPKDGLCIVNTASLVCKLAPRMPQDTDPS